MRGNRATFTLKAGELPEGVREDQPIRINLLIPVQVDKEMVRWRHE